MMKIRMNMRAYQMLRRKEKERNPEGWVLAAGLPIPPPFSLAHLCLSRSWAREE